MKRLQELDLIKVISVLSVISIHISAGYIKESYGYFLNQISRFAVPMFIIVSGFLLFHSTYQRSEIKYLDFIKRRLKKIYVPYIIWTVVYIVFVNLNHIKALFSINTLLLIGKHVVYGTAYPHLYFVVIIIQLYLLFPILFKAVQKNSAIILRGSFVVTLVFQTLIYLHSLNKIVLPSIVIPYYIFFPTWIFFFVLGMYFAKHEEILKIDLLNKKKIIMIIWITSLSVLLIDSKLTSSYGSSMRPSVILYSAATFILLFIVFFKTKEIYPKINKAAEWISIQSFIIYLCHFLILNIIKYLIGKLNVSILIDGNIGMLFLMTADIAGSILFAYIVSLTPAAELLGGVSKRKIQREIKK